MRCQCCNVILTPQESVRKFRDSGSFTDTCSKCLRDIPASTVEGKAFKDLEDYDEGDDQYISDEVEDWE